MKQEMITDIGKTSLTTRICKVFSFHAAHQLPNHNGKCKDLHGHTYKVEVEVEGEVYLEDGASDQNMVMDFDDLKSIFNTRVFNKLDHKYLNDVFPFRTTAENIARWIFEELEDALDYDHHALRRVRVWETETSWAEVCP